MIFYRAVFGLSLLKILFLSAVSTASKGNFDPFSEHIRGLQDSFCNYTHSSSMHISDYHQIFNCIHDRNSSTNR